MKAVHLIAAATLFSGSAAPANDVTDPVDLAKVTPPAPVSQPKRSIMIYLKPTEGMVDEPYPLRNEPYIVALDEVLLYRKGQRACDTVIQVCRPRTDGTFLNPGTPEERRQYCGPLEPADRATCVSPRGGSF